MTNLILARRRFLFAAPAIIAASSLMPGHSIAKLLTLPVEELPDTFTVTFRILMNDTGTEVLDIARTA